MGVYELVMFSALAAMCTSWVIAYLTESLAAATVAMTSAAVWGVMMGGW